MYWRGIATTTRSQLIAAGMAVAKGLSSSWKRKARVLHQMHRSITEGSQKLDFIAGATSLASSSRCSWNFSGSAWKS